MIEVIRHSFKPDYIVIHHSASRDGVTNDWEAIKKYHTSWRHNGECVSVEKARELLAAGKLVESPWSAIGYHAGIEMDKNGFFVKAGRPLYEMGAHVRKFNHRSIGVCMVGNFDKTEVPAAQWTLTLKLVKKLQILLYIPTDRVLGHREVQELQGIPAQERKTCPGNNVSMAKFRINLADAIPLELDQVVAG